MKKQLPWAFADILYPSCLNSDVLKKMSISLPVQNGRHFKTPIFRT